ncbi:NAD(P)/FAD-dependent oxidoreductase [Nocardiopsis coralliicola]
MSFEFVIVGGGAYGCAVAYHLASRGHSAAVLEAGEIGGGASGGPGKRGVRGNRRDLRELPLLREAHTLWPGLAEELGAPTGYVRTGSLSAIENEVVGGKGGLVAAEAHAQAQTRFGLATELWSAEEVRSAVPGISENVRAGLYVADDGVAAQYATTRAYAAAAEKHGAAVREGTRAVGLRPREAGRRAAVTAADGQVFEAERAVLLAANAAVPGMLRESFGVALPAWTVYPQVVLLRPEHPVDLPVLLGHDSRLLSAKAMDGGLIQLSGGWRGRFDPATGRAEPVEQNVRGNIAQLEAVLPGAGALERVSVHVSRPETAAVDQIPFIDAVPGAPGFYLATGWTGHGWALLPAASRAIAELLRSGAAPPALTPFSLSRIP